MSRACKNPNKNGGSGFPLPPVASYPQPSKRASPIADCDRPFQINTLKSAHQSIVVALGVDSRVPLPSVANNSRSNHLGAGLETEDQLSRLNAEISLYCSTIKADERGFKCLHLPVRIGCWDSYGLWHDTVYQLLVTEDVSEGDLAPGVILTRRTITETPRIPVRLSSSMGRIPVPMPEALASFVRNAS